MKKLRLNMIAAIAFVALFGVAYAAWVFAGETNADDDKNFGGIVLTPDTGDAGFVTIAELTGYKLYLAGPANEEIFFAEADDPTQIIEEVSAVWNREGLNLEGFTVSITWEFAFSQGANSGNYIEFDEGKTGDATYDAMAEDPESIFTFDIALPTFKWKTNKAPTTKVEYKAMEDGIEGNNIVLTVTVELTPIDE